MRTPMVAALVVLTVGCTQPETSILLVVDGDVIPGTDLDAIDLAMARDGAQIWSASHVLPDGAALPLTFVLTPTSSRDAAVEITVTATLEGRTVVEAERVASFAHGEQVSVSVCLWRGCIGSDAPGCPEGSCQADPGGADGDADADADGGAADDARTDVDAPTDAPSDARADAAGDATADSGGDGAPDGAPDADGAADAEADGDVELVDWICIDNCWLMYRANGDCDDGGDGSVTAECPYGFDCWDCGPRNAAECPPRCEDRECGGDGCGGSCGECAAGFRCMTGGRCVEWIEVRPVEPFLVGSPASEIGRYSSETQHEVTLTHAYELAAREVDQVWGTAVLGSNISYFWACGDDCPTEAWLWAYMALFCNVLSDDEGLEICFACNETYTSCALAPEYESPYECAGYRLPTRAEWEHAARAGTTTATYNGDLTAELTGCESPNSILDPVARFCGNSTVSYFGAMDCSSMGGPASCGPHAVGTLDPNPWGFYDMLGNVFELVHDFYEPYTATSVTDPFGPLTGTQYSVVGGGFSFYARGSRAAFAFGIDTDARGADVGFRPARTIFDE